MKRKFFSVLLALVLVLSFSLVTAVPAAAQATLNVVPFTFTQVSSGTAAWSDAEYHTGSYSVKLYAPASTGGYGEVVMPLDMEFENLADFSVWVEGGETAQALPLLIIEFAEATLPTSVDLSGGNNHPGGETVDLSICSRVNISSQPGQSEEWSTPLLTDAGVGWEKYGTHSDAAIDAGTDEYWTIFDYDTGPYDYFTWDQIQTIFAGATVTEVKVQLRYPQNPAAVDSTVYVDDITINGTTYYGKIQDAVDSATTTIISVAAGTYEENIEINKSLTLQSSAGAATTIITPADSDIVPIYISADDVTVDGFKVTGYNHSAVHTIYEMELDYSQAAAIFMNAVDDCTIQNNIIIDNLCQFEGGAIALFGGAGYGPGVADTVDDYCNYNTITNNTITGAHLNANYGIKIKGTHNTISNNTITDFRNAIHLWSWESKAETVSPDYNTISGNIISKGAGVTGNLRGIACKSGSYNTITGNTISGQDKTGEAYYGAGIHLYGGETAATGGVIDATNGWTFAPAGAAAATCNISGNTITGGHVGISLVMGANTNTVTNNTITGTTTTAIRNGYAGADGEYNTDTLCLGNVVNHNNISGNTGSGLINANTGAALDAENNWWGNASGPVPATLPATGYNSYGDPVDDADTVDYEPWLLAVVTEVTPTTYDKTLALKDGWTLVSTHKDVITGTTWVGTNDLSPEDLETVITVMGYGYALEGGELVFGGASATDLEPVSALYVKTDGGGGVGIDYSTSAPGVSEKMLLAGWNLISSATTDTQLPANAILSPLAVVAIGEDMGPGLATFASQGGYNQYTVSHFLPTTLSVEGWEALDFWLCPFDGYWIYMNAGKSFGVIPD